MSPLQQRTIATVGSGVMAEAMIAGMLRGELVVTYTDGRADTCREGDLFYWPPGHSVRVVNDSDVILFSPQSEHGDVLDHMLNAMRG